MVSSVVPSFTKLPKSSRSSAPKVSKVFPSPVSTSKYHLFFLIFSLTPLKLIMVLLTIGYNLHIKAPLSTYAENICVCVQTAILIVLHWKLNPKTSKLLVLVSLVAFSGIGAVMYLDILPDRVYEFIGIINIALCKIFGKGFRVLIL